MKHAYFYQSPLGKIGIAEEGGFITNLFFGNTVAPKDFEVFETPLLKRAGEQLREYFSGKRREFDLPLRPEGTMFQRRVWEVLAEIPYGQTVTYGEIAKKLGKPSACRAVGAANGKNPISIFLPCHRVIGTNGKLTGYAGGLPAKKLLLKLEGIL